MSVGEHAQMKRKGHSRIQARNTCSISPRSRCGNAVQYVLVPTVEYQFFPLPLCFPFCPLFLASATLQLQPCPVEIGPVIHPGRVTNQY